MIKPIKPEFFNPKDLGKRDWGKEELLAFSSKKWMMKKLFIKKGSKGGLQYHHLKDEGGFIVYGSMLVRFDDGNGSLTSKVLKEGSSFRFPPNCIHQEEALTDVLIIECSTPHLNDRVRVEEKYNEKSLKGLPSTNIEDIKII